VRPCEPVAGRSGVHATVGTVSHYDARKAARSARTKKLRGAAKDALPEYAQWLRLNGYSERSVYQYGRVALRWKRSGLEPAVWLLRLREEAQRKHGGPTRTAKDYSMTLRRYLVFQGHSEEAAQAQVQLPKVARYQRPGAQTALTPTDEQAFHVALQTTTGEKRAMLQLLAFAGLRQGEVRGLKLSDVKVVDAERAYLAVQTHEGAPLVGPKFSRPRDVPLGTASMRVLAAFIRHERRAGTSPWLFPSVRAGGKLPVSSTRLSRYVAEVKAAAGITVRCTPHTLRHTFITRKIEAGTDRTLLAAYVGHDDERSLQTYTHVGVHALWGLTT
jgi:integrase/recombinase XerD